MAKLEKFELDIAKAFGYDVDNPNKNIAKLAKNLAKAIKREIDNRIRDQIDD